MNVPASPQPREPAAQKSELTLDPIADAKLYPDALRDREAAFGRSRRFGIALSGGGIRSATLSLGFFQGLAQATGLLPRLDYLSTVSGGGYFGGFFAHLLRRPAAAEPPANAEPVADVLSNKRSKAIAYLRRNGRYLTPGGTGDAVLAGTIALRNWLSVIVVVALLSLAILATMTAVRFELARVPWLSDWTRDIPIMDGWILLSPWSLVTVGLLLAVAVPFGWAYWFVSDNEQTRPLRQKVGRAIAPVSGIVGAVLVMRGVITLPAPLEAASRLIIAFGVIALVAAVFWLFALWRSRGRREVQRFTLSRNLARTMMLVVAIAVVALIDTLGASLAVHWREYAVRAFAALGGVVAGIGAFQGRLTSLASTLGGGKKVGIPLRVVAFIVAMLICIVLLGVLAAVPYLPLVWGPMAAASATGFPADLIPTTIVREQSVSLWIIAIMAGVFTWGAGLLRPFVNRSSLHAFYEARLRRAYLGASNPVRHQDADDRIPDSEPHKDDALDWSRLIDPKEHVGPIHLVNVTINETIDGRTQTQQLDRRGIPFAVGPAGVSVSRTHHARWHVASGDPTSLAARGAHAASYRVFPSVAKPEVLSPSQWMAISGGAVSTGLGARTSLGFSLLLGLFNVRLGYWWRSGVTPSDRHGAVKRTWIQDVAHFARHAIPVQAALLTEWLARFEGTAQEDWNVSDGGHFENLGAYELLRRRLPLIIVCDFEQDADFEYGGLANLVRLARVDLDATITFQDEAELHAIRDGDSTLPRPPFGVSSKVGSLEALRRGHREVEQLPDDSPYEIRAINDGDRRATSQVHAALARIDYGTSNGEAPPAEKAPGWLLYVKASLTGDEPTDVLQYHSAHPEFPHESTADQFFDETQWEAYRALGEHLASEVVVGKGGFPQYIAAFPLPVR